MRLCNVAGCGRPHKAHGWCFMHYLRWRRHGTTDQPAKTCTVEGCDLPHRGRGFCNMHWMEPTPTSLPSFPFASTARPIESPCWRNAAHQRKMVDAIFS